MNGGGALRSAQVLRLPGVGGGRRGAGGRRVPENGTPYVADTGSDRI